MSGKFFKDNLAKPFFQPLYCIKIDQEQNNFTYVLSSATSIQYVYQYIYIYLIY